MTSVRYLLAFAAATAALTFAAASCGPVKADCGPHNCQSGCCDAEGVCQLGVMANACGTGGGLCQACVPGQYCSGGACLVNPGNKAGDGGTQADGGSCRMVGETCGTTSDCCEGECNQATFVCEIPPPQDGGCYSDGQSCSSASQCCTGVCNSAFTCGQQQNMDAGCFPDGTSCTSAGQCCTGVCNSSFTCGQQQNMDAGCFPDGTSCSAAGQCCTGVCNTTNFTCGPFVPPDSGTPLPGDVCSSAQTLSPMVVGQAVVFTATGTTSGYAHDQTGTCGGSGPDRVYVITAPVEVDVQVSLSSSTSGYSPVVYLTGSACSSGVLGCAVGTSSSAATFSLQKVPQGQYYIWVDGLSGSSAGSYTLTITATQPAGPPPGDVCTQPNFLSFSGGTASASGTTVNAVNDISTTASGCQSATGGDVFYQFTVSQTSDLSATLTSLDGQYQPALYLRQTCTGTTVTCDTAPGGSMALISASNLTPGTWYLVVDGAVSTNGPYTLDVTLTPSSVVPQGESCANPQPLTLTGSPLTALVSGDTTGASHDNPAHSCKQSSTVMPPDHVYSFTLATTRVVTITGTPGDGNSYDLGISLWGTPCASGTELQCQDVNYGSPGTETITQTLTAGTYYVWVTGYSSAAYGPYNLQVVAQ